MIQPNGKIESRHRVALLFRSDPTPRAGATVIVPVKDTLYSATASLTNFSIIFRIIATPYYCAGGNQEVGSESERKSGADRKLRIWNRSVEFETPSVVDKRELDQREIKAAPEPQYVQSKRAHGARAEAALGGAGLVSSRKRQRGPAFCRVAIKREYASTAAANHRRAEQLTILSVPLRD